MKGCSAGIPPIHVRITTSATRVQNRNWDAGRNVRVRCLEVCRNGTTMRTRIDAKRARTPPSLFGIDRRIAYANKKYHSGLMWGGVTIGLAGVKLSGSPRRLGEKRASVVRPTNNTANPKRSLYEKYGWNEILSAFELRPIGLFEPVSWRNSRCRIITAAMTKGNRKWKAKNRVRVALSTEKPPQIHSTSMVPT